MQSWWQVLISNLLPVIFSIIAPVLSYLIWKLLAKWKLNVDLNLIDSVVDKAANYAEQKAMVALKAGTAPTPGAEKMKIAIEMAMEMVKKYKLPEMAVTELEKLIEAKLGSDKVAVVPVIASVATPK
jgi:hypothetical protein